LVEPVANPIEKGAMTPSFLVVKSLDPPETVTDSLDLVSDEGTNADGYRQMAAGICTNVIWASDSGEGDVSGFKVSMEPTDACLFLSFLESDVPRDVIRSFIINANKLGAVVMSADSAEIVSGTRVD
jgi:hypothetical protein